MAWFCLIKVRLCLEVVHRDRVTTGVWACTQHEGYQAGRERVGIHEVTGYFVQMGRVRWPSTLLVASLVCVALSWGSAAADAQAPAYLVRDIEARPVTSSSTPNGFALLNERVFFIASTPEHGAELWSTDGSAAGTQMLGDLEPGAESAGILDLLVAGDLLYFTRLRQPVGEPASLEWWRSDGTLAGTQRLAQVISTADAGDLIDLRARALVDLNGLALLAVYDPERGRFALWRSEGTPAQTRSYFEVVTPSDLPVRLVAAGSAAFFVGYDPATGFEPWRTDGTPAGTYALGDLVAGPDSSHPDGLVPVGTRLLFSTLSGLVDLPPRLRSKTLWITDGTANGTTPLAAGLGCLDRRIAALGEVAYFNGATAEDPRTLWITDGTPIGTHGVAADRCGIDLAATDDRLFFSRQNGSRFSLWSSDGTEPGTIELVTWTPAYATALVAAATQIYFVGFDAEHGGELWRSDGSPAGTGLVRDIQPGVVGSAITPLGVFNGHLLFSAIDGTGAELWTSDGTTTGTARLKDIADTPVTGRSNPRSLTATTDRLIFTTVAPPAIWSSDGTSAGTRSWGEYAGGFAVDGAAVYLVVNGNLSIVEGDGEPRRIRERVYEVRAIGHAVYAIGADGLCRINGAEVSACSGSGAVFRPVPLADRVVFTTDAFNGEIWISDATPDGTHRVAVPGNVITSLAAAGSHVYFLRDRDQGEVTLWRTDGTAEGTHPVRELVTAARDARIAHMLAWGGRLLFVRGGYDRDAWLWASDGSEAGTQPIRQLCARCDIDTLSPVMGSRGVFLPAMDPEHGTELWVTDGTAQGTTLVADANPGAAGSYPSALTSIGDRVVFNSCDDAGCEPWITDGTSGGTARLADVAPGAASSHPSDFAALDGVLYFAAEDALVGRELWAIPLGGGRCASDCDGDGRVAINELVAAVGIALGSDARCDAADRDANGAVTIEELIAGVRAALEGC